MRYIVTTRGGEDRIYQGFGSTGSLANERESTGLAVVRFDGEIDLYYTNGSSRHEVTEELNRYYNDDFCRKPESITYYVKA